MFFCRSDPDGPIFFVPVISVNPAEEAKWLSNTLNEVAVSASHPEDFWTDRSKASIVLQFHDRVTQIHNFFDACRRCLAMVNKTMFPLNPQPKTLLALMAKFANPGAVKELVRKQFIAGAQLARAVVQAAHPYLNMDLIAQTNPSNLVDYYPLIEDPAMMIVDKMEASTDAELRARVEQERRA